MDTHPTKVAKNMSNKYGQKLLDSVKKSTTDAIKTTSKRANPKTAEATGDLIGKLIKQQVFQKKSSQDHEAKNKMEIQNERYISPEKRQPIIDELSLV